MECWSTGLKSALREIQHPARYYSITPIAGVEPGNLFLDDSYLFHPMLMLVYPSM